MMAKQHSIPVIIYCEMNKFSWIVQLDSFTEKELGTHIVFEVDHTL